jgi:CDP-4-dehydro-6-deoxyglucose reductase, E3
MSRVQLANGRSFEVPSGVTLLEAASHAGLALPHSCRSGKCGSCKAQSNGAARHMQGDDCLSPAERAQGYVLTCTDTADNDLLLDLEDLAELAALRTLTLPTRVQSMERPCPDVLVLRLRLPPHHSLRYLPGQYLNLIGPNGLRRAYSIASADAQDGLELHIRHVEGGAMSRFLFHELAANALLRIQAPLGSFHLGDVAGLHLVWLATGTGIAPFKAMLDSLQAAPRSLWPQSIRLYWGNRSATNHYWTPPPTDLPLQFTPVCSRQADWPGARGHVQEHALAAELPDRVFACGSAAMIESARASFLAQGLNPRHFQSDAFVSSS